MIYIWWLFIFLVGFDYFSKNHFKDTVEQILFSFLFGFSTLWCFIYIFINREDVVYYFIFIAYLFLFLMNMRRNYILLHIDSLTELFNRRLFERHINQRGKIKILSVYYIDINNFKMINDQYGHEEGDRILKMVANVLREALRKSDRIYRVGGDEFVVVAKITNEEHVERLIQKINLKLEEHNQNCTHPVSLSIGYAVTSSNKNLKSIVKKADDHMYQIKRKSKNQQKG